MFEVFLIFLLSFPVSTKVINDDVEEEEDVEDDDAVEKGFAGEVSILEMLFII
jgi:hypothetical protein